MGQEHTMHAQVTSPEVSARRPHEPSDRSAVLNFVRTPFAVRRNVVKVWRPLPTGLWTHLSRPDDRLVSIRRERWAVAGVLAMATLLVVGFSGVGLFAEVNGVFRCVPLLGRSLSTAIDGAPAAGWYYLPGQTITLSLWVVMPSLAGWAFVRGVWLPIATRRHPNPDAAATFARHLGCAYFYVYVMIVVGAMLMVPLILLWPTATETFRWCLWCFLFGESFFVPAAMWLRLVVGDSSGQVFGRYRYSAAALYVLLFVVTPVAGMVREL